MISSRTAKIILGASVFDDILGVLLLAVVDGLAHSQNVQRVKLGILAVEEIVFALFMIFIGPRGAELRLQVDRGSGAASARDLFRREVVRASTNSVMSSGSEASGLRA